MNLPEHINDVFERSDCLYSKYQVDAALEQMALEIETALSDTNPLLICVMIGGLIPTGVLLP